MQQKMKLFKEGEQNITYQADYDRSEPTLIDRVYLKRWAALQMGEGTIPAWITINVSPG